MVLCRVLMVGLLVAAMGGAAGCRMCAHPYDDCGPTFTGGCDGDPCIMDGRAGSILASSRLTQDVVESEEATFHFPDGPQPTPAVRPPQPASAQSMASRPAPRAYRPTVSARQGNEYYSAPQWR
jgi:hypothetical protein